MKKVLVTLLSCVMLSMAAAASQETAVPGNVNPKNSSLTAGQDFNTLILITNALQSGWETYEMAQQMAAAGRLTLNETEKNIQNTLQTTIPNIYNKIQVSSSEIAEELNQAYLDLAKVIVSNQTAYPVSLDTPEKQTVAVSIIGLMIASEIQPLIKPEIRQILEKEAQQMMQDASAAMVEELSSMFGF